MKTKNLFLRSVILISAAIFPLVIFDSCQFCPNDGNLFCKLLEDTPFAEVTDSSSSTVILSNDTLIVYHGFACARSSKSGTEDIIKIEGSKELPLFVTNATVFLNGWQFQYLDKDHHVAGLGTVIRNIKLEQIPDKRVLALKWEATGALSDDDFDDSYSMCYHYTIVAWADKSAALNADHDDGACDNTNLLTANFFGGNNDNTTTALSSYKSFLNNPAFISSPVVAILPRGFGMGWDEGCSSDHHLLQIAYNLGHSEAFIRNQNYLKGGDKFNPAFTDKSALVDSGFISWETQAIFKDNKGRRDYEFGEMVSGLSGADVFIIDPPYSILPNEDDCGAAVGRISSEEFVIKNVPFQYAIPMLTGWELGYICDDEHITKTGIWIENWSYIKDPLTGTGTLSYKLSADFSDKDSDDPNYGTHKVTILGIKPLLPVKIGIERTVDLIPIVPPGSASNSFCRRDALGNTLFVTIKNQGNTDAGASLTSVVFGGQKINVNTPPIKAGESVELLFGIAGNCFDPDCEFTIIADSQQQIDEGSNELNNSVTGICKRIIL